MRLTAEQIAAAKQAAKIKNPRHEHDDCIRMAYEWLDAQTTTKGVRSEDWKHIIERWCGRYITDDDVEVAALMHPNVFGQYPKLNISSRLRLPHIQRVHGMAGARLHISEICDEALQDYERAE